MSAPGATVAASCIAWLRSVRETTLAAYAQQYAAGLEHYLRLEPLQWSNFYPFWRH